MKIITKILLVILCFGLSACSIKSPEVYNVSGLTLPCITDINGGPKKLLSVESIPQEDSVRSMIYSNSKKYTYSDISDEELQKYFTLLERQGCFQFSTNCWQSRVNKYGQFIEVSIQNNLVSVSLGTI